MENTGKKRYAVINKEGLVLCISPKESLIYLPINEVTIDNVFSFWGCNITLLKDYLISLQYYIKTTFIDVENLDECSFLELDINEDTKEITFS